MRRGNVCSFIFINKAFNAYVGSNTYCMWQKNLTKTCFFGKHKQIMIKIQILQYFIISSIVILSSSRKKNILFFVKITVVQFQIFITTFRKIDEICKKQIQK